jgi:predicted amidohydrolase
MKLILVQFNILWEKRLKNLDRLTNILSAVPDGADILILPEMFNTGFSMNPEFLSEDPFSDTFNWMKNIAGEKNAGVCGSYIIKEKNNFYNRWIFVSPDGNSISYDKRHLFSQGGENVSFTRGTNRVVFNFRGVRIFPTICYDLRFPVWSRNRNDYDLLINAANWPESRRDVWLTLLKARAIENQCYVAGVNRTGTDGTGIKYCGDSVIFGPKGEMIASPGSRTESLITADVSLTELFSFRKKFPVLDDNDNFTLEP